MEGRWAIAKIELTVAHEVGEIFGPSQGFRVWLCSYCYDLRVAALNLVDFADLAKLRKIGRDICQLGNRSDTNVANPARMATGELQTTQRNLDCRERQSSPKGQVKVGGEMAQVKNDEAVADDPVGENCFVDGSDNSSGSSSLRFRYDDPVDPLAGPGAKRGRGSSLYDWPSEGSVSTSCATERREPEARGLGSLVTEGEGARVAERNGRVHNVTRREETPKGTTGESGRSLRTAVSAQRRNGTKIKKDS